MVATFPRVGKVLISLPIIVISSYGVFERRVKRWMLALFRCVSLRFIAGIQSFPRSLFTPANHAGLVGLILGSVRLVSLLVLPISL